MNVDATKEVATMELATCSVFVSIAPVERLPFGFMIAVELRLNCETPSAFMEEVTYRVTVLIPSVAVTADVLMIGVNSDGEIVILEPWDCMVGPFPNWMKPAVPPVIWAVLVWIVLVVRVVPIWILEFTRSAELKVARPTTLSVLCVRTLWASMKPDPDTVTGP